MTKRESDAALLRWPAAIMRNRRYIPDDSKIETNRLQSANGRFAPGARAFYANFDFLQSVAHGLTRCVLRHHLRRVSGAFARAFETHLSSTGPAYHFAGHVRDGDDRIVKC